MSKETKQVTKQDDKYKLFKQYMHNELGITKEDIKGWTEGAVLHQAEIITKRLMTKELFKEQIDTVVQKRISECLGSGYNYNSYDTQNKIKDIIAKKVVDALMDSFDISINQKAVK